MRALDLALRTMGITNIEMCDDPVAAGELVCSREFEIIILDIIMPFLSGQQLLEKVLAGFPQTPVLMVTGVNDVTTAVACMNKGAFDYILKPVDKDHLGISVKRALENRSLKRENERLSSSLFWEVKRDDEAFKDIITKNRMMLSIFKYIHAIGKGFQPVLITGETGTGKELIAKAVHKASGRKGELVAVNVAGLDDQVFSDTLFGHTKGAFTGADQKRSGLVERASGGTLFLDEIGDLSPMSQVKLLRLIQEKEYLPLGSDMLQKTDARVVVATSKPVEALKSDNNFRTDLFYRLRTHHIKIPPLRERKDDIPLLLEYYLEKAAVEYEKEIPTYPGELKILLSTYSFPGNIRELQAMVFDAVACHHSRMLSMDTFKERIAEERCDRTALRLEDAGYSEWLSCLEELPTIKQAGKMLVSEAMKRAENNQRLAARLIGISHQALNSRLKKKDE